MRIVLGEGDEGIVVGGLGPEVDGEGVGLLVPAPIGTGSDADIDGRPFPLADLVVDRCRGYPAGLRAVGVIEDGDVP